MISESLENLKSQIAPLLGRRRTGRLVRHYFLISLLLIAGGLVTSAVLEVYFRYRESQEQIARLQFEMAALAAVKIERFVQDITTAIRAATKTREVAQSKISPEYRFELKKLLYLAPAITEAVALDTNGVKQAHVSRAGTIFFQSRFNNQCIACLSAGFAGIARLRPGLLRERLRALYDDHFSY